MNTINPGNAVEAAREVKNRMGEEGPSTVRRSLTIGKLAAALCKAQGKMKNPPKDSVNPHFKSRYADLATVRDAVLPALVEHGLSVMQLPCELEAGAALTTMLMHESGEYVETTMLLRPSKSDPQGVGSALTYARRYALQSIAGVAADEDDDGNAASRPQQQQRQQPQQPREEAKPVVKDNMQLRAKHAQAYGASKTHAEYLAARKAVVADVERGHLSEADVASLRKIDAETVAKFPAPAKS